MNVNFDIAPGVGVGAGRPLLVLAGPCVLEDDATNHAIAAHMKALCAKLGLGYVFKASYDKANRTSASSCRGPGLEEGLRRLAAIKEKFSVPVVTDVHESHQVEPVAQVADILQIPAFLCRQTDLLLACAATGRAVNVKKGQFLAPQDMANVLAKLKSTGNQRILLCERGTTFGYHNLVVDMRGLQIMRDLGAPVVFDTTHSVQLPGGQGGKSGGQPEFIPVLSRAAAAVGIDSLFMEVHPEPSRALSDGANACLLDKVEDVLSQVLAVRRAIGQV